MHAAAATAMPAMQRPAAQLQPTQHHAPRAPELAERQQQQGGQPSPTMVRHAAAAKTMPAMPPPAVQWQPEQCEEPQEPEVAATSVITGHTHRAQWMAFQRACANRNRTPPSWADTYKKGGAARATLFAQFVTFNGDVDAIEMEMSRHRTNRTKQKVVKEFLTRTELLDRFKDPSIVDQIIYQKRLNGEWRAARNVRNTDATI